MEHADRHRIFQTINNDVTLTGGENPLLAGRYQVVRQLGSGGMGSVWLAEDTQLDNRPFAVKMLPSILVSNKRAYRQLKDEALVAMKLTHPNIVTLRAFEENNGNPFLVMDYIEGQTLDEYLADKGTLSEEETIKILKPVAAALDYAHGEGVVHRDVKPANVMIRKDGRPFVLDFGIAREMQETMTRVTGKFSSGTLMYMSPEQLNGEQPKKEQDIYSFAAMVYECLKGETPFVRGQIEYQIINNPPPPLPQGIASWLSEITMRGLSKKADERPATCCEILGENVLGECPVIENMALQTQKAIKAYQDQDDVKAFFAAQKADKNNAEIQYILGRCYALGRGVDEDQNTAMQWLRKAAYQGNIDATCMLRKLYQMMFDDDSYEDWSQADVDEFEKFFLFTLKSEDPQIRHSFARIYVGKDHYGEEIQIILAKVDEKQSLELIRSSADSGYGYAQYVLGCRYETGNGIKQDYTEAVKWYRKASEHDCISYSPGPLEKLGEMYKRGLGVTKDYDEALKWYRKAVEVWDSPNNRCNLAQMYETAKNFPEALKWYRNAAEKSSDAQVHLADCYRKGLGVQQDYNEAIKWYLKAAESENPVAQYRLAEMYYGGLGVEINEDMALQWCRKAAEQGLPRAQIHLGILYEDGDCGLPKDGLESKRLFRAAKMTLHRDAEQGDVDAQFELGNFYFSDGGTKNAREALLWYRKAAEQGLVAAQYSLAKMYEDGDGIAQDYGEALNWYRKASDQGDEDAQYAIGMMYYEGEGLEKDWVKAAKWFQLAAEQDKSEAQYKLAWMYENGEGVIKDEREAVKWYRRAAEGSDRDGEAKYRLGLMYENGCGVRADLKQAVSYYQQAVLCAGHVDARFHLGYLYYHGNGVKQDYACALRHLRRAATNGHSGAQYYLGLMYYNGEGVEKNHTEAVTWFRKAAEQDDTDAQYALAVLYQSGRGVTRDNLEALKWYRKAAEQGHEEAKESLKELTAEVQFGGVSKTDDSGHKTGDMCTLVLPGDAKMEMIYVAPGSFMMGSPTNETGRFRNEIQHRVTITNGYWLGKYPVTQKEWVSVMGDNPAKFENDQNPVEQVSWERCQEFCKRLNKRLNCGARLPTEAEWEYACRAGSTGGYGVNGSIDQISWHCDNSNETTHPVGQKMANNWGFMDMHGNVWEWCEDWYGDYSSTTQTDPRGPESGDKRVARGGSWFNVLYHGRSAMRSGYSPGVRDPAMGFRLCCTAK